jgi:hypothetical protein
VLLCDRELGRRQERPSKAESDWPCETCLQAVPVKLFQDVLACYQAKCLSCQSPAWEPF